MRSQLLFYILLSSSFISTCFAQSQNSDINLPKGFGPSSLELKQAALDSANWLYHTRDYEGTRHSPLTQIDLTNVQKLQPICISQIGGDSDFQAGPVVYKGILYLTAGEDTLAINAASCEVRWRHQWISKGLSIGRTNRGVAIANGYVVRGTSDGNLIALDAETGNLLWSKQVANPEQGERFTMAPMIFEDKILIGPAGTNSGISGWIGAFKLGDGEALWRFYTVPGDLEDASNLLGVKIGGGAVWTPFSLDVEKEILYAAVTNPAPNFSSELNPGNNLYTNSIVALNVHTGELLDYQQLVIADDHGWDLTQVSPLFNAQINGEDKKLVATSGKDGMLRVLDRNTLHRLYETPLTTQLNSNEPVTLAGTYTCPGVLGGVLWNGPALVSELNLLISPSVNLCSTFYRSQETRYVEGKSFFDGVAISDPETMSGWLNAIDFSTGELRWKYETDLPLVAAVTTTAGGIVLSGEMSGDFIALNSHTGEKLYRFNTGGAIGAGVITYAVDGRQYIAVASGHPSEYQVNGGMGSPTLLVFSLPNN